MRESKQAPRFPIWVVAGGVVLLVAALALGVMNNDRPPGNSAPLELPASEGELPYPEIDRVDLADAKSALDSGTAVFLDVRSAGSYAESHIPQAMSIPISELPERLGELDPGTWIIPYCT